MFEFAYMFMGGGGGGVRGGDVVQCHCVGLIFSNNAELDVVSCEFGFLFVYFVLFCISFLVVVVLFLFCFFCNLQV